MQEKDQPARCDRAELPDGLGAQRLVGLLQLGSRGGLPHAGDRSPLFRRLARARSTLRGWAWSPSRSWSSRASRVEFSEASPANAASRKSTTGSDSLCARLGPGRCGTGSGIVGIVVGHVGAIVSAIMGGLVGFIATTAIKEIALWLVAGERALLLLGRHESQGHLRGVVPISQPAERGAGGSAIGSEDRVGQIGSVEGRFAYIRAAAKPMTVRFHRAWSRDMQAVVRAMTAEVQP